MDTTDEDDEATRRQEEEKERRFDAILKRIGELENEEERILGKRPFETFILTRKIDPSWDAPMKGRIEDLEQKLDALTDEFDELLRPPGGYREP